MNVFLRTLLLFDKFEIKTKLTPEEIDEKVGYFARIKNDDYYADTEDNGFYIAEKFIKHQGFITSKNSFAPIATAKYKVDEGVTTVSVIIHMRLPVAIIFVPIYLLSLASIVPFPFMLLISYFSFVRPAEKLKDILEYLVAENDEDTIFIEE